MNTEEMMKLAGLREASIGGSQALDNKNIEHLEFAIAVIREAYKGRIGDYVAVPKNKAKLKRALQRLKKGTAFFDGFVLREL